MMRILRAMVKLINKIAGEAPGIAGTLSYTEWAAAVVFTLMLIIIFAQRKTILKQKWEREIFNSILGGIGDLENAQDKIGAFLKGAASLISADMYAFYSFNDDENTYELKSVNHKEYEYENIRPSYAGLLPYNKDNCGLKPVINSGDIQKQTNIIKNRNTQFLALTVGNGKGLIVIGPVKRISKAKISSINRYIESYGNILCRLIQSNNKYKSVEQQLSIVDDSINSGNEITRATLPGLVKFLIGFTGCNGGMHITGRHGKYNVQYANGVTSYFMKQISNQESILQMLFNIIGDREYAYLSDSEGQFYELPECFVLLNIKNLLFIKTGDNEVSGLTVLWCSRQAA